MTWPERLHALLLLGALVICGVGFVWALCVSAANGDDEMMRADPWQPSGFLGWDCEERR